MLTRLALRLCVVQALIGQTWAKSNVKDSEISVIDANDSSGNSKPYLAVYTDDQDGGGVSLVIEIGVTARMSVEDDEGGQTVMPGVPVTDATLELTVDLIERQIWSALKADRSLWSDLVHTLSANKLSSKSVRGSSKADDGERYAGRQIVIACDLISEPEEGYELVDGDFWSRFLSALDASPDLNSYSKRIRAELTGTTKAEDWIVDQRALAVSNDAGSSLGFRTV